MALVSTNFPNRLVGMLSAIRRFWRGELPLANAFWNWAVFGALLVNAGTSALFYVLITNQLTALALVVGYGLSVPYNLFAMVGVWRAADRHPGSTIGADAVRIVAVVFLLVLCVT